MADALWEGHTLLKTGLSAHRHTHGHRQTKVKTVYPPLSLRSLVGYNNIHHKRVYHTATPYRHEALLLT